MATRDDASVVLLIILFTRTIIVMGLHKMAAVNRVVAVRLVSEALPRKPWITRIGRSLIKGAMVATESGSQRSMSDNGLSMQDAQPTDPTATRHSVATMDGQPLAEATV